MKQNLHMQAFFLWPICFSPTTLERLSLSPLDSTHHKWMFNDFFYLIFLFNILLITNWAI
jgi:hypothetical protein